MDTHLLSLLNLLEEEFGAFEGLMITPVFPSKTERSPDLPQNYDPKSKSLHRQSGVRVRLVSREYFFPTDWFSELNRNRIHQQIEEIRERLAD